MPSNQQQALLECGCGCAADPCECEGRCVPLIADTITSTEIPNPDCDNPISVTLSVDLSATSSTGDSCFNGSGTITYKTALTGGVNCWEGTLTGNCTDCNGTARTWEMLIRMCCPSSISGATVSMIAGTPAVIPVDDASVVVIPTTCDPFLAEGCIPGDINAFVVGCYMSMPPTQTIYTNVCFQIYETP